MLDYFGAEISLKTVSLGRRLISGHAAAHHNIDRVRDIVDPGASAKAVSRLGAPSDVEVLIAHNQQSLPVGIPQRIEATPQGLYTETYVLKGPAGDNLLAVAKDLLDHGLTLGMSIGFKTHDSRMEQTARGRVRRILDYELKEFSFASRHAIANPLALVSDVKSRQGRKAMSEGSDTTGGALVPTGTGGRAGKRGAQTKMQYRVEQQDGKWLVYCDADSDGDADDNRLVGTYASEEMANAVVLALRREAGDADDAGTGDDDEESGAEDLASQDKTHPREQQEQKAEWSTAFMNDLPDSSFLFVEEGGAKDSDGKTVPRSKRHFPVKDASGKVDLAHVRNAIARIPQSDAKGLDDAKKAQLQARARRMLGAATDGKAYLEPEEWKTGSPLTIWGLGCRLQDISEQLVEEYKAMALLGEEHKAYQRIRQPGREDLATIAKELAALVQWAETLDRGEDGRQRMAMYRQRLALAGG